jgi:hypothetical protein
MKKLLIFFIIGLFILYAFNGVAISIKENITTQTNLTFLNTINPERLSDELDQSQTEYDVPMGLGWWYGYNIVSIAQSFTPQKNVMTRIFLYLGRVGTPNTFQFAIRKTLDGGDLATVNKAASQIPGWSNPQWVEFNFEDVPVIYGEIYYLICTSTPKTNTWYEVWYAFNNPYKDGKAYVKEGGEWMEDPNGDFAFKTYGKGGCPNKPIITGPDNGKAQESYSYNFIANDPDGDDVSYYVKWGDGDVVEWTTFQASGPPGFDASHSWNYPGTYYIEAKAKDVYGHESDWSDPFRVSMKKDKAVINNQIILLRLLEKFPVLQNMFYNF